MPGPILGPPWQGHLRIEQECVPTDLSFSLPLSWHKKSKRRRPATSGDTHGSLTCLRLPIMYINRLCTVLLYLSCHEKGTTKLMVCLQVLNEGRKVFMNESF